jgi:ubiquinone/menaquinone biosynthesis C-methylase UbiE
MLTPLLHRIVAHPRVYDACQLAAGASYLHRRLARAIEPLCDARFVIDIGGGTGGSRDLWSPATRYVCLDLDPQKLAGYAAKHPGGLALQADATRLPLADGIVDAVVCTLVTHHLTDDQLDAMLADAARVLSPGRGRLILLDAVWAPRRLPGRLLWRYDRGSFPRPEHRLRAAVDRVFEVDSWQTFAVWHRYALAVARPRERKRPPHT